MKVTLTDGESHHVHTHPLVSLWQPHGPDGRTAGSGNKASGTHCTAAVGRPRGIFGKDNQSADGPTAASLKARNCGTVIFSDGVGARS